jgi:peptidyl-prolyl cis-trans isomerase C
VGHNRMITKHLFSLGALLLLIAAAAFPGQAADQDKVLAKIGDQVITETDLKQMTSASLDGSAQSPEGQARALEYLVNMYAMAVEAQKLGMDKDPEVQRFLRFNQNHLLARVFLEKASKNIPEPSDKDAKAYFEKNRDQFTIPESVVLHHILVQSEKEANDILARLKKGEKFSDIASQVSICSSREKGGNLGLIPRGGLVKEIEDVAFSMKKGETKGPVQSKFGYHVLFLEDKKAPQESNFDQVQAQIMERLKMQAQEDNYNKLAQDLRKKLNVQVMAPPPAAATPAAPATPPNK